MRRKLVAANWKMHGSSALTATLLGALVAKPPPCEVVVFPPFPYLTQAVQLARGALDIGAQDLSAHVQGAYTGEVSAAMLHEVGARWVLVGHSERRQYHHEGDALIAAKLQRALECGLTPVLCVGETLDEHERDITERVIAEQLRMPLHHLGSRFVGVVIAYEPIWAIGTGRTASAAQVQAVHAFIRSQLAAHDAKLSRLIRLLYGGSVKAANASELFAQPDVDGGLVGGASLLAEEFLAICVAAR
jgi:triosephosphate isomerase